MKTRYADLYMKRCLFILATLLFATSFSVFAQKSKADKYYKSFDYRDAASCYKSVVASHPADTASLMHLAACYRILRDYDNAEKYYAQAVSTPGISYMAYFYYGEILKNNGKIDEARAQFTKCTMLNSKDSSAAREARYCDKLKKKFYVAYQVNSISGGLNSGYSDFAPVVVGDNLVFTSDRAEDLVNMNINGTTGGNFFKVYECKPSKDGFGSPKTLSFSVNKAAVESNVGPVSFSADGNEMFFTEVGSVRKKNFVNQAKLYYCEKTGNSWGKPQPFDYNSDKYSVMDAALSPDGQTLYFASTMPGGFGGSDLYMCQRDKNGSWSKPKNLGSDINTPGNEAFPCVRKDGLLFFASDRHFNYGGLDIFSAKQSNGKWTDIQNLGPDVNSAMDDFGISFNSNNRTGYFCSNRKGGKGFDDIYSFLYIGDYRPLKGSVLLSYNTNDPVSNVLVRLVDENGKVLDTMKTNAKGGFAFSNLEPDKKYMIKVDENDSRFAGKKKFYLADSNGKIVAVTLFSDPKMGKYIFKALPTDLTSLNKLTDGDKDINIAGNLLQGDSSKPMANVKVSLVNTNGDVLQTATTNAFGAFVFTNLPPDDNYQFKVDDLTDTKLSMRTKVVLTDKGGNTIKTFYIGKDGKFTFAVLASDTSALSHMMVDDPQLRLGFSNVLLSDKKMPLANVKVSVVDNNGSVLQSTLTAANGQFAFTNLPPDKSTGVQVDANDPKLSKMNTIYIADSKNNILKELRLNGGSFKYELLEADKKNMGNIYVYDPMIDALVNLKNKKTTSIDIVENVYYDYEKWDLLPAAERVLDKVVKIMHDNPNVKVELDAYTDPRGTDQFNMDLSQKRADAAVAYMVAHGVTKARLTGKGFGKTHPLNNCGDPNAHCTDAQYAVNRRTEFKIIQSK